MYIMASNNLEKTCKSPGTIVIIDGKKWCVGEKTSKKSSKNKKGTNKKNKKTKHNKTKRSNKKK